MSRNLMKYKLIYSALNILTLGVVMYKLSKMGLLSFSSSAYIDMIPPYVGKEVIAHVWCIHLLLRTLVYE